MESWDSVVKGEHTWNGEWEENIIDMLDAFPGTACSLMNTTVHWKWSLHALSVSCGSRIWTQVFMIAKQGVYH
jgi:hypothetical protein